MRHRLEGDGRSKGHDQQHVGRGPCPSPLASGGKRVAAGESAKPTEAKRSPGAPDPRSGGRPKNPLEENPGIRGRARKMPFENQTPPRNPQPDYPKKFA